MFSAVFLGIIWSPLCISSEIIVSFLVRARGDRTRTGQDDPCGYPGLRGHPSKGHPGNGILSLMLVPRDDPAVILQFCAEKEGRS